MPSHVICITILEKVLKFLIIYLFFFLSEFSFTDTDNSQNSRGREKTIFFPTLPLPSAHEYPGIYLQVCTWDDYSIFLIATLVLTRLLFDEIYRLIELLFDWLMMWCWFLFVDLLIWFYVLLLLFDMRNRWTWTRIDYHPCITTEPKAFKGIFKFFLYTNKIGSIVPAQPDVSSSNFKLQQSFYKWICLHVTYAFIVHCPTSKQWKGCTISLKLLFIIFYQKWTYHIYTTVGE